MTARSPVRFSIRTPARSTTASAPSSNRSPTPSAPTSSPCRAMIRWTRNCGSVSRRPDPNCSANRRRYEATLRQNAAALEIVADRLTAGVRRVVLVGCGDSLAVMIAARQALETALGVPCEPMQSLEFAYYHADLVDDATAVIALSSSGETTRTVEALLVAQHRGSYTVALTNTDGSTLAAGGRRRAEDRGDPGRLAHPVVHRRAGIAAGVGHPDRRTARTGERPPRCAPPSTNYPT